ncbi:MULTISPECIES: ABC transporter permease [unclassified Granulicatella]|uniref:ABC transporter permease n=1 Tax=unclassified Granulicatella TaxID=2630493 RepID=UPI00107391FE|nr:MULTISPECIES: ABC transporter permease [unclassified Granulicatella]MBF0780248.1 ABC transporter permease [Granulicatella sp. 19428wC4_WM01]TFU95629.1 ABC transporter permease [Granulicatella sp. WM01]
MLSRKNRILLQELIKTDFKLRYQGSVMGHLWSILKPLLLFGIMYIVFVRFLKFDDGTPHNAVGLLLGMTTWNFFSEATNMGMHSIVSRGDLIRKLNFSKYIIVISSVMGAMINYIINLGVVVLFALINGVSFNLGWLMIIPLLLELVILATGISLVLASLYVKFRDIAPIWEVILQGGLYATPIIYSITFILQRGGSSVAQVMLLNPMAQIIQDLRHFLIHSSNVTVWQVNDFIGVIIPYIIPVVMFMIGFVMFNKNAKKFAEIL